MRKIFKYPVPIGDYVTIALPRGAQILTVRTQREEPYIWALVDPNAEKEDRKFRFAGTGHPITESNDRLSYIGTFFIHGDALVFHLFEVR